MIQAFIYGFSWAGIVMLFDFTMWEGNIFEKLYDFLNTRKSIIYQVFGICQVCFGFWFGLWYLKLDWKNYFIFLGASQVLIIFFHLLKIIVLNEVSKNLDESKK